MKKLFILNLLLIGLLLLTSCAVTATEDAPFNTIKGRTGEDTYAPFIADIITGAAVEISLTHFKAHEGNAFISDFADEILADDETIVIVFRTTPGTNRVHLFIDFATLVGGDLRLWEDVTWTTGTGVLNPILNRKRIPILINSNVLEDLTATPAFTATNNLITNPGGFSVAGAIPLHHIYTWGVKNKILAGSARDTEEWILEPDTQYGVVFTADGAANKAHVVLNWYEHEDNE